MAEGAYLYDLAARITADTSAHDRALTASEKKVLELAKQYPRIEDSAKKASTSAGQSINKLGSDIQKQRQTVRGLGNDLTQAFSGLPGGGKIASTLSSIGGASGPIGLPGGGKIASTLSSIGGASGPIGLTALALGALAVATAGAAAGIYKLVASSAEATGKFYDLSQQTGFSVETLSALNNAAETSGGSIDSITNALFLFETKMGEAKDKTSETSKIFQAFGIDTTNNEQALRQSINTILAMTNAEDQATVGKKLFGRSVKDLLGAIKEAGGLEAFLNQQLKEGTLITTQAAKQGDVLSDSVTVLGRRANAVGRSIAAEFAPMVSEALSSFSAWLRDNQAELIKTARQVATLVKDISNLASFIYQISPIKLQIDIVRKITTIASDLQGPSNPSDRIPAGSSLFDRFRDLIDRGPVTGSRGLMVPVDMSKVQNQTKAQIAATAKANLDAQKKAADEQRKVQNALKSLNTGRGGGGGGGGTDPAADVKRLADLSLRATLDGFKAQEDALKRSLSTRRVSLEQFTTQAIDLEIKQRNAVIEGLEAQEKAVRPGRGSAVALAEIRLRKQEEERKSAESTTKYIDALSEDFANQDKIREEGMLRVKEIMAGTEKDLWQRLADQRVINQETAVKAIAKIERDGLVERMGLVQSELARAGADATKQREARMQMGEIESQIGALAIETDRRAADALRERLSLQRQFNGELEQSLLDVRLQGIELQKQSIIHGVDVSGEGRGRGRDARRAIDALDIQREMASNEMAQHQLLLNNLRDMEKASFEEQLQLLGQFIAQKGMLEAQHVQYVKEINERQLVELRQQAESYAADLTNVLDRALTEGFRSGARAGFAEFLKGILDIIKSKALLELQNAIADAITKGFQGGSAGGGSIWSQIAQFGISFLGSLFGGGGGLPGKSLGNPVVWGASGGIVPGTDKGYDSQLAMLRPGEMVLNKEQQRGLGGGGGEVHHHYKPTIIVQVPDIQSAGSRTTQHQVARQYAAMLQKAQLTG